MKKVLVAIMSLVLLTCTVAPASAQTRGRYYGRAEQSRRYEDYRRYDRRDDDSFWDEHKDKVTVGIGTAAGAAVGAAAGGKKGAIIGALIGAGASALYTYGLRDRDDNNRWRRR